MSTRAEPTSNSNRVVNDVRDVSIQSRILILIDGSRITSSSQDYRHSRAYNQENNVMNCCAGRAKHEITVVLIVVMTRDCCNIKEDATELYRTT